MERKPTSPPPPHPLHLRCLSLKATSPQETRKKQHRPELHPEKKNTHQNQQGDLQYTLMSSHITKALSSCSVARLLSVSVWGMTHIHPFLFSQQVRGHNVNSTSPEPPMTHRTSLQSQEFHWQRWVISHSWENTKIFSLPTFVFYRLFKNIVSIGTK